MGSFIKSIEEHVFTNTGSTDTVTSSLGLGQDISKSIILPSNDGSTNDDAPRSSMWRYELLSGPDRISGTRNSVGAGIVEFNVWVIEFGDQFDVQTGSLNLAGPQDTNTATISEAPLADSFGVYTFNTETGTNLGNAGTAFSFDDSTTIRADRFRTNDTDDNNGTYFIATYTGPDGQGISVQHGSIALLNVASNTATISEVTLDKSFLSSYNTGENVNAPHRGSHYADLTNSTTVTATRDTSAASPHNSEFQVIEFEVPGGKTQENLVLGWSGVTTTTAINVVNSDTATVHSAPLQFQGGDGTAGQRRQIPVKLRFNSSIEVELERTESATASNNSTSVQVVEWPIGRRLVFGMDK